MHAEEKHQKACVEKQLHEKETHPTLGMRRARVFRPDDSECGSHCAVDDEPYDRVETLCRSKYRLREGLVPRKNGRVNKQISEIPRPIRSDECGYNAKRSSHRALAYAAIVSTPPCYPQRQCGFFVGLPRIELGLHDPQPCVLPLYDSPPI